MAEDTPLTGSTRAKPFSQAFVRIGSDTGVYEMKRRSIAEVSNRHPRNLQLVLLSDTHELHREIPAGDIFIHAGDFTMFSRSLRGIVDFNEWLGELPHQHKIVVPGNHETFLQTDPENRSLIGNATVLINQAATVAGLRIWGSPVTPSGPAFGIRSDEKRERLYCSIPADTEVLITHGPPFGILDCNPRSTLHQGDRVLLEAVKRVRPKIHVFGHIHGAYGIMQDEHTTFVNAGLLGRDGDLDKKPIALRIAKR